MKMGWIVRKILYSCSKTNDIRRLKKPQISEVFPQRTRIFRSKLQSREVTGDGA